MAKKIGVIQINLNAGTTQFLVDMDKANASITRFGKNAAGAGHATVTSTMAASASIRALEGNFTNNIRAVEKFVAVTLKMGPILQAAFPLVGGVAFAELLVEMGSKLGEFITKMMHAPERIKGAFRELTAPIQLANDELQVANDKLANEIAKLQGKRENTLRLQLDEARVAADKLAESLMRDLSGVNKLLKEENVGIFARLMNQAGTGDISEEIGGKTGQGGFTGRVADITDQGNAKIRAATDIKAKDAAQTEMNTRLMKAYGDEIASVNQKIAQAKEAAKEQVFHGLTGQTFLIPGKDEANRMEQLLGLRRDLQAQMQNIPLRQTNEELTGQKQALEENKRKDDLQAPYKDLNEKLDSQLTGIRQKLSAAAGTFTDQVLAKGAAASTKAIEELNKELGKHNGSLTMAQQATIRLKESRIAVAEAEEQWKTKLTSTSSSVSDQIRAQERLTAAIGQGYEAVKAANVETQLMKELGERGDDPAWMRDHQSDVSALRGQYSADYEARHRDELAQTTDQLRVQTELERTLAAVQQLGAQAVRDVTLALRLKQIAQQGGVSQTREQIEAEKMLADATRANQSAANISKIDQETSAVQRLTIAQLDGAEAVRRAQLETKYSDMQRNGASSQEINRTRGLDEAEHQREVTTEALKTAMAFTDGLASLNAQIAALEKIKATQGDSLGLELSLRDLEDQRFKILSQTSLAMRGASDGVRAFFYDMQEQAKSTASIVYDSLHSAFDKLSENLTQLITGGKAKFGKMFQDLGRQLVNSEVKQGLQGALGSLGQKLGISSKPDGSSAANALWVRTIGGPGGFPGLGRVLQGATSDGMPTLEGDTLGIGGTMDQIMRAGMGGLSQGNDTAGGILGGIGNFFGRILGGSGSNALGGLFGGGSMGGGIFSFLSSLVPHFETGTPDSPSGAYLAGEEGPELIRGAGQSIASAADTKRLMSQKAGDNVYYTIDARGTDPVQTEQRVKAAILAAHKSAIVTAVQASDEKAKRTPQTA